MADKINKKNPMPIVMVALIVLLVGYIGYDKFYSSKNNIEEAKDAENYELGEAEQKEVETVEIKITETGGKIEKVANIEPKELQVVSLGNVTEVSEDGSFSATVYEDTVTPVAAMLPDKEFGLMAINTPGETSVSLNAQTTAEALVFMSPYLVSSDPELAANIKAVIEKDEAVKEFARVMEEVLEKDVEPLEDEEFNQAYGKAIESVLETLNK